MPNLVALVLATFWAWETVRYAATTYAGRAFDATRAAHPFVAAIFPLVVLWPCWIEALAVAGTVGILHLAVERFLSPSAPAVTLPRRPTRNGLPPLPG